MNKQSPKEGKKMNPLQWILGNDTGISSKTIWAVMMGETDVDMPFGFSVPHDPSDFGRCYRLLQHFPKWRDRLPEVAEKFPEWRPLIREWDKLEALYEEEALVGRAPKLYALIRQLIDEGREANDER